MATDGSAAGGVLSWVSQFAAQVATPAGVVVALAVLWNDVRRRRLEQPSHVYIKSEHSEWYDNGGAFPYDFRGPDAYGFASDFEYGVAETPEGQFVVFDRPATRYVAVIRNDSKLIIPGGYATLSNRKADGSYRWNAEARIAEMPPKSNRRVEFLLSNHEERADEEGLDLRVDFLDVDNKWWSRINHSPIKPLKGPALRQARRRARYDWPYSGSQTVWRRQTDPRAEDPQHAAYAAKMSRRNPLNGSAWTSLRLRWADVLQRRAARVRG